MKKYIIYLLCILSCTLLRAQTESCLAVLNEVGNNRGVWDEQTGIDYILSHKDSFDMENEMDVFIYNYLLGPLYFGLSEYSEALPYLRNVTTICDTYGDEMEFDLGEEHILLTYFLEALCESYIDSSKDIVLDKLYRAKFIFEKYNLKESDVYDGILIYIDFVQSGDAFGIIQTAGQYITFGNYNEAIALLEDLVEQPPVSLPIRFLATAMGLLGSSYLAVERLSEAENVWLKAIAILDENEEQRLNFYRYICSNLGGLYYQVHNYQKAKDYMSLSKQLHEKYMDFGYTYFLCLSGLAKAESDLKNHYTAKLYIDVALKYMLNGNLYKEIEEGLVLDTSITDIELDENFSDQMKRTLLSGNIPLLSNAAAIYYNAGFFEEAVISIESSKLLGKFIGEPYAHSYLNFGTMLLNRFEIDESLQYFEKAFSLCQTDYDKTTASLMYALALWMARSRQCIDVATKASENLTGSISTNFAFLSQEERTNFFKDIEPDFLIINYILYESGDENQYGLIYNNILTTKALLLRTANNVKNTILNSGDQEIIDDYNRMIALRQQLVNERDSTERVRLSKEAEQLDKILSRNAASYGAFIENNAIKWENVRNSLDDDEIAIEFYYVPVIQLDDTRQTIDVEPRYYALLLRKDYETPHIIFLCKESELKACEQYDLYNTDMLYRLIWQPLESELLGVNNIYFSADRDLHQIGIEYAQMPDHSCINDKYSLYRLSSTRVLAENNKSGTSNFAVLFGGLRYDMEYDQLLAESRGGEYHPVKASRAADMENLRYGVKYLPGTKEEVEAIERNFKSAKDKDCELITGIAGTEEAFHALENTHPDIIHLATHGFFWSEEEVERRNYVSFLANANFNHRNYEDAALLRSGLFFSGANIGLAGEHLPDDVEDGILTAKELSEMNLGYVDMVVLSACQSGLGKISGEGVFGLQRGFKLAGANTLLMSLWKVDDEATCLLMTEFYKNYLNGQSKYDALRQAQVELRSNPKYADPEYWAAFILLDGLN